MGVGPPGDVEVGSRPSLVGRAAELGGMAEVFREVDAGAGRAVVVQGEAGIGKSRLLAEALALAGARGLGVARGSVDELVGDRPLGALAEAFALDPRSADPERAALGRLLDSPARSVPALDVGFRIVEALLALLERMSRERPVVVAVEDLHWADPATLRAVRSIGRVLAQLPVVLVVTLRPFPRRPELDALVDELVTGGGRLWPLVAIGPVDVAHIATETFGAAPGPRLARQLAWAGGNPLFVVELLSALVDEGAVRVAAGRAEITEVALPSTLALTIARRLRFIPEASRDVLEVASILGRRFPLSHLAQVMDRTPVELLSVLSQAMAAGLLGEEGDELAFRHELIREVIYADLAAPIRQGLHRQAAAALARSGAPAGQVAEHLLLGPAVVDGEAIEWLVGAARQAAARAPTSAVRLFERALVLAGEDELMIETITLELAPLLIQTGRAGEAERLSRAVLGHGPDPMVEVALRRALGEVLWTLGWLEPAIGELDAAAALASAHGGEPSGPLALAGYLRVFVGQPEPARAQAGRALAEGERSHDEFAVCLALQTLAILADARAEVDEAVRLAERAVRVAAHSRQPRVGHLHPHLTLGLVLLDSDRSGDAEHVLQEGRRRAEERGTVLWLPLYHSVLALHRVVTGAWDDAVAEAEVGLALADEVGSRLHASFLHGIIAWIALQRGGLSIARGRMDEALREFIASTTAAWQGEAAVVGLRHARPQWPIEWGLWITASLREAEGDPGQATFELESAWALAEPLRCLISHRMFGPHLVRLALGAGRRDLAASVTAEIEEAARRSATASARGAALRCRGLLDDDPAALVAAVEALQGTAHPMERAFAAEDAGLALARAGRVAEGVALLEQTLGFAVSVGADHISARVEAGLRSLGVRHRRAQSPRAAVAGWDSLTETELRVVRLVAEGLTNRQAGERLFVSRRTVETHLAHVFAKLGLSSRSQLAAAAAVRD